MEIEKQTDLLPDTTGYSEQFNEDRDRVQAEKKRTGRKKKESSLRLVDYSSSSKDFSSDDSIQDPTFLVNQMTEDNEISDSDDQKEVEIQAPTRWRKRNPLKWKANITKQKRSMCLPYVNKTKLCRAKLPQQVNCTNCRFKCSSNFTEHDRTEICKAYWGLRDNKRQKDFIIKNVQSLEPKRRKVDKDSASARAVSKIYHLENSKGRFRTCANFFRKTLCISNGPIETALKGKDSSGTFQGVDRRGRKTPGNKTSEEQISLVKEHIESFPVMESHYVRQSSKKKYLDSRLSILKMYELYTEMCKTRNERPVSEFVYRNIFCTCYNLAFFKPKKDQCATCSRYKLADNKRKKELEADYSMHIIRKNECNEAKEKDKVRSQNDVSFVTANFDLQSVLQLPYSAVSEFYYARKICVYNLTIYEGFGKNAYCFCWNELNGKRGSNEIGSILLMYIEKMPSTVTEISLFCDTCGGQNRNQQVAAALLYAVHHTHMTVIELKFLESGHSHMECDSMHSAIENAKKNESAFIMNDWINIFKRARSCRKIYRQKKINKAEPNVPYQVKELKYGDFKDLQSLASELIKNRNRDENGDVVSWLKIKCLKFEKNSPSTMYYRYDHTSEYKRIDIRGKTRLRRNISGLPDLKPAYARCLPISEQKKDDIMKLCRKGLIPEETHHWYETLPVTMMATDRLPEPDVEEEDLE